MGRKDGLHALTASRLFPPAPCAPKHFLLVLPAAPHYIRLWADACAPHHPLPSPPPLLCPSCALQFRFPLLVALPALFFAPPLQAQGSPHVQVGDRDLGPSLPPPQRHPPWPLRASFVCCPPRPPGGLPGTSGGLQDHPRSFQEDPTRDHLRPRPGTGMSQKSPPLCLAPCPRCLPPVISPPLPLRFSLALCLLFLLPCLCHSLLPIPPPLFSSSIPYTIARPTRSLSWLPRTWPESPLHPPRLLPIPSNIQVPSLSDFPPYPVALPHGLHPFRGSIFAPTNAKSATCYFICRMRRLRSPARHRPGCSRQLPPLRG